MNKSKYPFWPILIVDDEPHTLASFDIALRTVGINNTIRCQDSREVLALLNKKEVGVLLLDLMMPYVSGQEILSSVKQDFPDIPVIIVSGVNEMDTAIQCMHDGAFDFVSKPVDTERLLPSVKRAIEMRQLRDENTRLNRNFLAGDLEHPEVFSGIVTQSNKMQVMFKYCEAIAAGQAPILITGETGVGKELVAQALHKLSGREYDMVAVNVAGLDDHVFSDTLFGHVRGAFTGADRARPGLF
jgi:DNA-binding NtrC family response regulator